MTIHLNIDFFSFFFSSRRRHTRCSRDWSSDVCSSDLMQRAAPTSQLTLMMTSIAGVLTHGFLGHPDYLQAAILSAGAFVGAQIGSRASRTAKEALLQRLLGLALIVVAIEFIIDWLTSK